MTSDAAIGVTSAMAIAVMIVATGGTTTNGIDGLDVTAIVIDSSLDGTGPFT